MKRGIDLFMKSLVDRNVNYIFGNPGSTESPMMDSLKDYPIEYILSLHEGVAVGMATTYALGSNNVSVVNLHVAAGLGNGLGMLYNAFARNAPVLITAGQIDNRIRLRKPLLGHNLVAMAEPLVKWSVEAQRADELPLIMHRAFKIALSPPRGPVFLSLPMNVLAEETEANVLSPTSFYWETRPDSVAIKQAAEIILKAKKPVIICGEEVGLKKANLELVRTAELIGAAVWDTMIPSAVSFPRNHPQFRGDLPDNHEDARKVIGDTDLVLLVGGDFLQEIFFTGIHPWPEDARVIEIQSSEEFLARNFAVELGILSAIKPALHELNLVLSELISQKFQLERDRRNEELALLKTIDLEEQAKRAQVCIECQEMTPARLFIELKEVLPIDAILVEETNTARGDFLRTFLAETPGDYFGSLGGGIGQGLPGAVGYKLAYPDRPVIAVSGDGSAMFSVQTLWSAVHHHIPVVFIILANRAYKILKVNMDRYRKYFEIEEQAHYPHMDLTNPDIDYVMVAKGLGMDAEKVYEPEEVAPALQRALASGKPYLLEVFVEGTYPGV